MIETETWDVNDIILKDKLLINNEEKGMKILSLEGKDRILVEGMNKTGGGGWFYHLYRVR